MQEKRNSGFSKRGKAAARSLDVPEISVNAAPPLACHLSLTPAGCPSRENRRGANATCQSSGPRGKPFRSAPTIPTTTVVSYHPCLLINSLYSCCYIVVMFFSSSPYFPRLFVDHHLEGGEGLRHTAIRP